jgi:hypothetical protein
MSGDETPKQIAWTLDDWMAALGRPFSVASFYNRVHAGKIRIRKDGGRLLITTSPAEFLASCPTTLGRSPRRKRSAA